MNNKLLLEQIEKALELGRFISYYESSDFVRTLERVKEDIDKLLKNMKARQSVPLYEVFLSGCYEKANEIDGSDGYFGMFFDELFCSWVNARQKASLSPEETIQQILKWMDNDEYGFCYGIEKKLAEILNKKEITLFKTAIRDRFDNAFNRVPAETPKRLSDYPFPVRHNADILKVIYQAEKDIISYIALCEKLGITPKDCENIATIYHDKRLLQDALFWVEKGLELEAKGNWANQSSCGLTGLKRELLAKLGRKDDALESAWAEFEKYPEEYTYDELMKYVPRNDYKQWHKKAIDEVKKKSLSGTIKICIKTKEYDILNECIISASNEQMEDITYTTTQEASEVLIKKNPLSAAKIYRSLGMHILKSKKSKCYKIAIEHFHKAKSIYEKTKNEKEWLSIVDVVSKSHFRKYNFMKDFEKLVSGNYPEDVKSFIEKTRERWEKQTE